MLSIKAMQYPLLSAQSRRRLGSFVAVALILSAVLLKGASITAGGDSFGCDLAWMGIGISAATMNFEITAPLLAGVLISCY
jgi:hypothetical protein